MKGLVFLRSVYSRGFQDEAFSRGFASKIHFVASRTMGVLHLPFFYLSSVFFIPCS